MRPRRWRLRSRSPEHERRTRRRPAGAGRVPGRARRLALLTGPARGHRPEANPARPRRTRRHRRGPRLRTGLLHASAGRDGRRRRQRHRRRSPAGHAREGPGARSARVWRRASACISAPPTRSRWTARGPISPWPSGWCMRCRMPSAFSRKSTMCSSPGAAPAGGAQGPCRSRGLRAHARPGRRRPEHALPVPRGFQPRGAAAARGGRGDGLAVTAASVVKRSRTARQTRLKTRHPPARRASSRTASSIRDASAARCSATRAPRARVPWRGRRRRWGGIPCL